MKIYCGGFKREVDGVSLGISNFANNKYSWHE